MKKSILRNILLETLLTNRNLQVFFKDYAKEFTTPDLAEFFWWLFLRSRLRFRIDLVSNRCLTKVFNFAKIISSKLQELGSII